MQNSATISNSDSEPNVRTSTVRVDSALNIIGAIELFVRHWRRIAIVVTGFSAVGILYTLLAPSRYTAKTQILGPQPVGSSGALLAGPLMNNAMSGSMLSATAGLGLSLKNPNDLYVALLKSRPIAEEIVNRFELTKIYHAKTVEGARKQLEKNTVILSEKGGLLSVSVIDTDRTRAAQIANNYIADLKELTKNLAIEEATQRRQFYEDQLKRAKDDLISAELAFQSMQKQKGIVQFDAQAKAAITSIGELQASLAAKQVEYNALKLYSTELNPTRKLVESELATLQAELDKRERSANRADSGNPGLQDLAKLSVEYLRAEHELQYRQMLFDLLAKQDDAAKIDESKDGAVIQVVEPAIPPETRTSPRRGLTIALFALCGLLLVCGQILGWHYLRIDREFGRLVARVQAGKEMR